MLVVIIVAVPVAILSAWALLFDIRHRRNQGERVSYGATRGMTNTARWDAQAKGSKWGAGG